MTKLAKGLRLLGTCLVLAAVALTLFNLWDDRRVDRGNQELVEELCQLREEKVQEENFQLPRTEEHQLPFYELFPDVEMPVITANGRNCIGTLEIPAQSLNLSVMENWTYERLRYAPCRYSGSAYTGNLILCAHNYTSHFGGLASLEPGSQVQFTDGDGNVFRYEVTAMEILQPDQTEAMQQGDWDLTLFTCTLGGESRVTVRCTLVEAIPV